MYPRRTQITLEAVVVRDTWVRFRWSAPRPTLSGDALSRLDSLWRQTGFSGAAFVVAATDETVRHTVPLHCPDQDLVANVLLRTRGDLLLGESPLLDDPLVLDERDLLSDDPRLHALTQRAFRGRAIRESPTRHVKEAQ